MVFIVVALFAAFGVWMLWLVRQTGGSSRNEPSGGDGGVPPVWPAGTEVFSSDTPSSASGSDSAASGGDCGCGGGDGGGD